MSYDHEIKIGSDTYKLALIRDDTGRPYYSVDYDKPEHNPELRFIQETWNGGHGQYEARKRNKYFAGESIDTTIDGKIFLGPLIYTVQEDDTSVLDSAVVDFLWYANTSEWLCATSGKIYRYNVSSSLKWTAATTTVAGVLQLWEHDGVAYAAVGKDTKYWYSTTGDTWTQTDLTDGYANKFFTSPNAAGTSNVLWKVKLPNELTDSTNGKTVAAGGVQWSSPAYIGDTSNDITNIFLINDQLVIGKTDGLIHYDSDGGLHYLLNDLRHNRSTNNFKYQCEWQSASYFSMGGGLAEITSYQAYEPMGPLTGIDDTNKVGIPYGLTSDKDWLYTCYKEGTSYIIYKGVEVRTDDDALEWRWCPWVNLSTSACGVIKVCQHSATDRRLWFGYGTNTGYVIITDNPLADSNARFAAAGKIQMSYFDAGHIDWSKLWQSTTTNTDACTANLTVTPKYRKDDTTSWAALGAAVTTDGVNNTKLTTALSSNRIQFELDLATNSSSATPVVLFFQALGILKPTQVKIHDCTYAVADNQYNRASTIKDFLNGGASSTSLIKFADLRYDEKTSDTSYTWVVMEPGFPQEVEIVDERKLKPEVGIKCRFREVSYTVS